MITIIACRIYARKIYFLGGISTENKEGDYLTENRKDNGLKGIGGMIYDNENDGNHGDHNRSEGQ